MRIVLVRWRQIIRATIFVPPGTKRSCDTMIACVTVHLMSYLRDATNRGNSRYSTGPRSEEGKARSSQNSLRYAFLSSELLLPDEDPKALSKFRVRLRDQFRPVGPIEQILVERIVHVFWRLGRLHRIESALLAGGFDETELVVTAPVTAEPPISPFEEDEFSWPRPRARR